MDAYNLSINPPGAQGQTCSGTYFAGQLELCRRDGDGALGSFEVFMEDLQVTPQGEVLLAGRLGVGYVEVSQAFDPDNGFSTLTWQVKDASDGSLMRLPWDILSHPQVQAALEGGDPEIEQAVNAITAFVSHYLFNQEDFEFSATGFIDCVDPAPDEIEEGCLDAYDLLVDHLLDARDYARVLLLTAGAEASQQVADVNLPRYRACKNAEFFSESGAPNAGALDECLPFDSNQNGEVNKNDLAELLTGNAAANFRPIAYAGEDQAASAQQTALLNGTGSYDLEARRGEQTLTYTWTQVAGTSVGTIAGANNPTASFNVPLVTAESTATFLLTVTDSAGFSSSDTVDYTLTPPTAPEPAPEPEPTE